MHRTRVGLSLAAVHWGHVRRVTWTDCKELLRRHAPLEVAGAIVLTAGGGIGAAAITASQGASVDWGDVVTAALAGGAIAGGAALLLLFAIMLVYARLRAGARIAHDMADKREAALKEVGRLTLRRIAALDALAAFKIEAFRIANQLHAAPDKAAVGELIQQYTALYDSAQTLVTDHFGLPQWALLTPDPLPCELPQVQAIRDGMASQLRAIDAIIVRQSPALITQHPQACAAEAPRP
jgi:hypothetical protein